MSRNRWLSSGKICVPRAWAEPSSSRPLRAQPFHATERRPMAALRARISPGLSTDGAIQPMFPHIKFSIYALISSRSCLKISKASTVRNQDSRGQTLKRLLWWPRPLAAVNRSRRDQVTVGRHRSQVMSLQPSTWVNFANFSQIYHLQ